MPKQNSKGETAVSSRVNMSDSKTAAIYLRRSAVDGSGEDISITYQREACERLAKGQGLQIVRIFNEGDGQAASIFKNNERPEYEAALLGLGREYKTLIAYSVDRLSRKGMTSVGQMLELAENQDGRIITNDGLDTDQSSSRLVASFMGELAYAEVKKTSERVSAAKEQNKKKGSYLGGSAPFGYQLIRHIDAPTEVVVDQEKAEIIQKMADRYIEGASLQNIANWLNDQGLWKLTKFQSRWSHTSVRRVLTNPAIVGYRWYGTTPDDETSIYCDENGDPVKVLEPIISEAQFHRIQKKIEQKNQRGNAIHTPFKDQRTLLGGFLKCSLSGNAFWGSRRKSRDPNGPTRLRYFCECGQHEDRNSVFDEDVEPYVVGMALMFVSRLLKEAKDNESEPSPILDEVAKRMTAQFTPEQIGRREELEGQLLDIESRKAKLFDDYYRDGKIDEENYNRIESQLAIKMDTVGAELRTLPKAHDDFSMFEDLVAAGDDLVGAGSAWSYLEIYVQKSILMCLVDQVVVSYVPRGGKGKPSQEWKDMVSRIEIEFVTENNIVELASRTADSTGRINKKQKKATA